MQLCLAGSKDDDKISQNTKEKYEKMTPPKTLLDEHKDGGTLWYYLSKVPIVVPFVIYTKKK